MTTEAKHTREDWHISGKALAVVDQDGKLICVCNSLEHRDLIAAAPDLLEALKCLYEFCRGEAEYNYAEVEQMTLSAIARAEGREP